MINDASTSISISTAANRSSVNHRSADRVDATLDDRWPERRGCKVVKHGDPTGLEQISKDVDELHDVSDVDEHQREGRVLLEGSTSRPR